MYKDAKTKVRCGTGMSGEIDVGVGLHQGSALSPFLFAIIMNELTEGIRLKATWCMIFADNILCGETIQELADD